MQVIALLLLASAVHTVTNALDQLTFPPFYPALPPFGYVPLPLFVPMVDPYYRFLRDAMAGELLYRPPLMQPPTAFRHLPLMMPFQHPGVLPLPFTSFAGYRDSHFPAKLTSVTRRHASPQASPKSPEWSPKENYAMSSEKQFIPLDHDLFPPPSLNQFADDRVVGREKLSPFFHRGAYPLTAPGQFLPGELMNRRDSYSIQEEWPEMSRSSSSPWETDSSFSRLESSRQDMAAIPPTLNPSLFRHDCRCMRDMPQKENMPIPQERTDTNSDKFVSERDTVPPAIVETPISSWTENRKANKDVSYERELGNSPQGPPGTLQDRETLTSPWRRSPPSYQIWEPYGHYMRSVPQKWELETPEKEQRSPALQAQNPAENAKTRKDDGQDSAGAATVSMSASAPPEYFHGAPLHENLGARDVIQVEKVWPHPSFTQSLNSPPDTRDMASSVLYSGSKGAMSSTTTSSSSGQSSASSTTSVLLPGSEGQAGCPEEHVDSFRLSVPQGTIPSQSGNSIQDFPRNLMANSLFGRRFNYFPDQKLYG